MQDIDKEELAEVEEVLQVVKAAKLMTEVVTTVGAATTAETPKVGVPRKRRGVIIQDPVETTLTVVMHSMNFDRENLEPLWKLVKEWFEKTDTKNYSDDYMLKTLRIIFGKPDVEASVWRDQKGRYGLAKRYLLTHFTLEQMLNTVRLKVKEVSEMSLELLRLVRRQLIEDTVFLRISWTIYLNTPLVDERLLLPPKHTPPKTDKTLCTRLLLDFLLIKDIQFERDDIFNIILLRKHSSLDTLYSF
nr:hypothetical protein [Tanacetum cinerariifolium]